MSNWIDDQWRELLKECQDNVSHNKITLTALLMGPDLIERARKILEEPWGDYE